MNWHAVAGLAEKPDSCAACQSSSNPDDTDYCKCYEAQQGRAARPLVAPRSRRRKG